MDTVLEYFHYSRRVDWEQDAEGKSPKGLRNEGRRAFKLGESRIHIDGRFQAMIYHPLQDTPPDVCVIGEEEANIITIQGRSFTNSMNNRGIFAEPCET